MYKLVIALMEGEGLLNKVVFLHVCTQLPPISQASKMLQRLTYEAIAFQSQTFMCCSD